MYSIDLYYLRRINLELDVCARKLSSEIQRLDRAIRELRKLESEGMTQVRRALAAKKQELEKEYRMMQALSQALRRILETYQRSENQASQLFEAPVGVSGGLWSTIRVMDIVPVLSKLGIQLQGIGSGS